MLTPGFDEDADDMCVTANIFDEGGMKVCHSLSSSMRKISGKRRKRSIKGMKPNTIRLQVVALSVSRELEKD
jgi:hypothetical protein